MHTLFIGLLFCIIFWCCRLNCHPGHSVFNFLGPTQSSIGWVQEFFLRRYIGKLKFFEAMNDWDAMSLFF
jgi:hypothetical protein